jgi:septum formation protein
MHLNPLPLALCHAMQFPVVNSTKVVISLIYFLTVESQRMHTRRHSRRHSFWHAFTQSMAMQLVTPSQVEQARQVLAALQAAGTPLLTLGSSSSARAAVLSALGIPFTTAKPGIDEGAVGVSERAAGDAHTLTLMLAHAKADALAHTCMQPGYIITCDQVTLFQGRIREKPVDPAECRAYLASYGPGRPAQTISSVLVMDAASGRRVAGTHSATQEFMVLPAAIIEALIHQGDVMHCCGGFMIDSPLVAPYLGVREGGADSILGLPASLLLDLIRQVLDGVGILGNPYA